MIFIIVALLIAIVSVIIGYNMMAPNDNGLGTAPTSTNSPASATNTPTDTANNVSSTSSPSNSASKNGYSKMTISGVTCVYPSTFNSNPTTGNQKLNLTDALGGATMTVSQEGKSGAPSDLMRDYARQTGGEVSYSRAGDDWYAVTVTTDDTVYHRKCVLKNGIAVYYDFSYSSMTSTAQKYTEYIDYMEEIGGSATGKSLPVSNFVGYQVSGFPHFRNYPNGQGFLVSHLGFYFWKYYNRHVDNMALRSSTVDYLLFGIEEVMLNYAEAKFELGEFSQSVADATINKLRVRAVIPSMNVSEIDASFDLNRDQSVDPVLWEIRRERRIELMGDGFRFRDLKRWKKGLNRSSSEAQDISYLPALGTDMVKAADDYMWVWPIPKDEIDANPQIKGQQNAGY